MIETPSGRLRWLRGRSVYRSAAEFAREVGVPEVTYRAHELGTRGFGEPQARRYAAALDASWVWLLTGEGQTMGRPEPEAERTTRDIVYGSPDGLREADLLRAVPAPAGEPDLPVYASAEGGSSGMLITESDRVDWVRRPQPLLKVRDAFAVYVVGDSMEPRYEQGDMILVHPGRPVGVDNDVLLLAQAADGSRAALIKRLVRSSAKAWTVRQYNPPREYDLPRAEWQQAYVVVGKYNRL